MSTISTVCCVLTLGRAKSVNRSALGQGPKVGQREHGSENLRKYESSNGVVQLLLGRFLKKLTRPFPWLMALCER